MSSERGKVLLRPSPDRPRFYWTPEQDRGAGWPTLLPASLCNLRLLGNVKVSHKAVWLLKMVASYRSGELQGSSNSSVGNIIAWRKQEGEGPESQSHMRYCPCHSICSPLPQRYREQDFWRSRLELQIIVNIGSLLQKDLFPTVSEEPALTDTETGHWCQPFCLWWFPLLW